MSINSSGRPHYVASAVPTDHHPAQAKLHKTVGRSSGARSFALLLLLGTLLGMAPGLASASHEAIGPPVFTPLGLPVNDFEFDRHSGKIYPSVPSRAGALGNRIVQIDPKTGALGPSVFVGSEPFNLAVSDDEEFLYVGLDLPRRCDAFTCRRSPQDFSSRSAPIRSLAPTSSTTSKFFLMRFPTGAVSSPPGLPAPTEAAQAQIESFVIRSPRSRTRSSADPRFETAGRHHCARLRPRSRLLRAR